MISRFTDVGGVRMHHRAAGPGWPAGPDTQVQARPRPPLVFVHGLAVSSTYFVPLAETLAAEHLCAAVDLPGFGNSGSPAAVLGIPALGDALAAWLVAAGLGGAAVVANSAGCQVAVECAVRHPGSVGPLILIGPTVDPSARSAVRQIARLATTCLTRDVTQAPLALRDIVAAGPHRVVKTAQFMLDHRIEQVLPAVRQPTLIIRGAWDPICPQPWIQEATALLPQGWFTVVAGGAHLVHLTHPARTADIIRSFLAGTSQTRAKR